MTKNERFLVAPQQHIRNLFAEIKDNKLKITYYPTNGEEPYGITYSMRCTNEEADTVVQKFETLIDALDKFGKMHDELENEEARKKLLTSEEISMWETYISPFDPFDVDGEVIYELYMRCEGCDCLSEEEDAILDRYYEWKKNQCLKRLPFVRRFPTDVIERAKMYEYFVRQDAPQNVLDEEARCLAEEIVLYYCFDKDAKNDSVLDRILSGEDA